MAKKLLISLDAGHGMGNIKPGQYDPGASAAGLTEAAIALEWVLTFKERAKQRGVQVHLIRSGTTDSNPVSGRDNESTAVGATHQLSIHCNAGPASSTGVETFYRDAGDKPFADAVQKAALKATKLPDRKVKTEAQSQHPRLAVLSFPKPACLVEIGFLTNPTDRDAILDKRVRIAFADAVLDYLMAH